MNRAHFVSLMLVVCALPVSQAQAADTDAMAKAANGFYAVYATFHPSDGIPDDTARAKYAPYISPKLNELFASAHAAQDRFAAANKDTPPLIEGDLITSNFEGATSFKVGACTGDAKAGRCAVDFTYVDTDPKNKPVRWTDTASLVNTRQGWRVDDIAYGAKWDFSNKGRMSDTLKMAIATAND
jgi:hypothetical protein